MYPGFSKDFWILGYCQCVSWQVGDSGMPGKLTPRTGALEQQVFVPIQYTGKLSKSC